MFTSVTGLLELSASNNITFLVASEVNASAATVLAGSTLTFRRVA